MNENIRVLEEKIAYLERHVTEQDKAMLEFAEQIEALRRELKALRDGGAGGDLREGEEGNLSEDRPPHY